MKCPKCGTDGFGVQTWYCAGCIKAQQEHLHIECVHCRYEVAKACCDSGKKESNPYDGNLRESK